MWRFGRYSGQNKRKSPFLTTPLSFEAPPGQRTPCENWRFSVPLLKVRRTLPSLLYRLRGPCLYCAMLLSVMLWWCMTVVSKDTSSTMAEDPTTTSGSYEWFVGMLNTALSTVTSPDNAVMLSDADADIVRQVAVLYRVTQLAVDAVGGPRSARSLLDWSSRCYHELFAAHVAHRHGLVSIASSSSQCD